MGHFLAYLLSSLILVTSWKEGRVNFFFIALQFVI